MNYHVVIEGQAVGPYTPQQLAALGINGETLIWYQGLENWVPAASVPEVMAAISAAQNHNSEPKQQPAVPQTPVQPQQQHRFIETRPASNLAFAIIGLFMFFALGIPALIKAIRVNGLWAQGQHEEAIAQSNSARKLGLIAIIIGAVLFTLNIFAVAFA